MGKKSTGSEMNNSYRSHALVETIFIMGAVQFTRDIEEKMFFTCSCSSSRARLKVEAIICLNTCEIHMLCPQSEAEPGSWCSVMVALAELDGISECGVATKTCLLIFKRPLLQIDNIQYI